VDKNLLWRFGLIAVVVGLSVFFLYPPEERIHLGLDLRGGIHLVLRVNTEDAIKAELDDAAQRLVSEARTEGLSLGAVEVQHQDHAFKVPVPANVDATKLSQLGNRVLPGFKVTSGAQFWTYTFPPEREREVRDGAVRQTLETLRNRVDQFGVAEPVIQRQGMEGDRIIIQLPGVDDPARVKALIHNTALLEFQEVVSGPAPDRDSLIRAAGGSLPPDAEVVPGDRTGPDGKAIGTEYYLLKRASIIAGRELRSARRGQDQYGMAVVNFATVPSASNKFGEYTGSHIGTRMAIVLDSKVLSAPVIKARIPGEGVIEGNFSIQEAEDLALMLRAGALPASITYLEERTVGPSLGRDSVIRGLRAGIIGIILVAVFMLVYYKGAGINANVALVLNAVILLGALGMLKATLTLPGIAGVILTIGMAVDSNVLIFERIREELDLGKTVRNAVSIGFSRALSAIIDSNLTTIISALFLFQFGTGPVKGFAVTLTVGLLISMFTAVFVSRAIFDWLLTRQQLAKTLSI
jgi:preprotein translocase subunit SecD